MDHAKPDFLSVSMNIDLSEIKHVAKIARNPEFYEKQMESDVQRTFVKFET